MDGFMEWKELPNFYRRVNGQYMVNQFLAQEAIKKGEFETTESNLAKKKAVIENSVIAPGRGAFGIALHLHSADISISYDADKQAYKVEKGSGHPWCMEGKSRVNTVFCSFVIADYRSEYKRDPLGRTIHIERGKYFGITAAADSTFARKYAHLESRLGQSKLIDQIPYPVEQAQKVKTDDIQVTLIGTVAEPLFLEEWASYRTPGLKITDDWNLERSGIPFKVDGIIYSIRGTSTILAKRDFRL